MLFQVRLVKVFTICSIVCIANGLKVIQWPGEFSCCMQEVLCKLPEYFICFFILGNVQYEIEVIQLN